MKKRIVSLFLCICLVAALLPVGAMQARADTTAWDGTTVDTAWYNTTDTTFTLTTPEQLAGFAAIVNGTATGIDQDAFADKTVRLGADIDLGGQPWMSIAAIEYPLEPIGAFVGTFDGGEYSISNLYMNTADYHAGLFGYVQDATIQNVHLIKAAITAKNEAANAILISYAVNTSIIGCAIDDTSAITFDSDFSTYYDSNVAGLVTYLEGGLIKDCVNNAAVTAPDCMIVAGIVAQTEETVEIGNCENNGAVSGYDGVGGIVGQVNDGNLEITGCANTGTITGASSMVGGIVGCLQADASTVSTSYNTGTITGTYEVGGIVGNLLHGTVTDCYNAGSVTSTRDADTYNSAGGIVGVVHGTNDVVSNCLNVGTITAQRDTACGELAGTNKGTLENCAYPEDKTAYGSSSTGTAQDNIPYTDEQLTNGEVADALNGDRETPVWKQNIGTDNHPNFKDGTVTITFDAGEGTVEPASMLTNEEGKLAELPTPSRGGYSFEGWYDGEDPVDASTVFTKDTTLTAKWKRNAVIIIPPAPAKYTLSFAVGDGTAVEAITEVSGTVLDLSGYSSALEGYAFTGWFADEALTEPVTSLKLTEDTTVYAGWEKLKAANPFADVSEEDWFYEDVMQIYEQGLMKGVSEDRFDPEGTTSRAMIVTILYRMEEEVPLNLGNEFADVEDGLWYTDAVSWAAANGIVTGYGDGTFGPEDPITREQLAAILYRYAEFKGYDISETADLSQFRDAGQISGYAQEAMAWANGAGILTGKGDGILDPAGSAKRCEAAAMICRFQEYAA